MTNSNSIVFSGVQPTGNLHLGNYLGAIKNWINLQHQYNCLFCIVDMHALTVLPDPTSLLKSTREVTASFIASGIDHKKHIIFNQSQVPQHAELAWVFNCIARIGWMSRMTQFKDKAGKDKEKSSIGLFSYPILMAADILLYKATHVPVGSDQKQHIELTRDIAQKFNGDYRQRIIDLQLAINDLGDFFPNVHPIISQDTMRIMSLKDGNKKMSKSDNSDLSRINLTDSPDQIAQKIRKAKTDSDLLPEDEEHLNNRPEANNLLNIYAALANITKQQAIQQFANLEFSYLKKELIEVTINKIAPITNELKKLNDEPDYIDGILKAGAEKAKQRAEVTMSKIRDIVGFLKS
ncbi:tryptophan--tRNA ligase [Bartonella sp. DGB1]|uniref:tryptophan--tRNA ligase n=1 Tax=Bartonella sp. DGB1 TaxID=3239807 RepID=UPI003526360C